MGESKTTRLEMKRAVLRMTGRTLIGVAKNPKSETRDALTEEEAQMAREEMVSLGETMLRMAGAEVA